MVKFGIDILLTNPPEWKRERIGLVTNHAATTNHLSPSRKALLQRSFNIQKLFSPEHGLDVMGADGHEMKDGTDALTNMPIISLYSTKLAPSDKDLEDLDIILFDIPDVGSRFYTYLWTMTHVMEACAKNNKKLIILDRPNPVSGDLGLAEGPILDMAQASFIGRWPIPIRHSCTLGELALYFNAERNINCDLEVIKCEGWNRNDFQPDWGIDFVPTSPAIQNFQSMLTYPGLCLLEATNISEGRGTKDAFRLAGAPWIKGQSLATIIADIGLDEIHVTAHSFIPSESKYKGETCNGILIEVKHPESFQPVYFGLMLIRIIKQTYPQYFDWAPYPTMVNPTGKQHLDKLLGITDSEKLFALPLPKFIAEITKMTQCRNWTEEMQPYLQY